MGEFDNWNGAMDHVTAPPESGERLTATPERDAIVAYLRALRPAGGQAERWVNYAADAIERGEHIGGEHGKA